MLSDIVQAPGKFDLSLQQVLLTTKSISMQHLLVRKTPLGHCAMHLRRQHHTSFIPQTPSPTLLTDATHGAHCFTGAATDDSAISIRCDNGHWKKATATAAATVTAITVLLR